MNNGNGMTGRLLLDDAESPRFGSFPLQSSDTLGKNIVEELMKQKDAF